MDCPLQEEWISSSDFMKIVDGRFTQQDVAVPDNPIPSGLGAANHARSGPEEPDYWH